MTTSLARWISIVAHPFVMAALLAGPKAALIAVVPVAILMIRQVRRGRWESVDASNARERPVLFVVAGLAVLALCVSSSTRRCSARR